MSLGRFKLPVQPFPSPLRWQPLKIVTVELLEGVQHRHLLSVAASRVQVVQADAGYPFLHICVVRDSKLGEMCCHHQLLGDDAVNDLLHSLPSVVAVKGAACGCPSVEFVSVLHFDDGNDFQHCVMKNI